MENKANKPLDNFGKGVLATASDLDRTVGDIELVKFKRLSNLFMIVMLSYMAYCAFMLVANVISGQTGVSRAAAILSFLVIFMGFGLTKMDFRVINFVSEVQDYERMHSGENVRNFDERNEISASKDELELRNTYTKEQLKLQTDYIKNDIKLGVFSSASRCDISGSGVHAFSLLVIVEFIVLGTCGQISDLSGAEYKEYLFGLSEHLKSTYYVMATLFTAFVCLGLRFALSANIADTARNCIIKRHERMAHYSESEVSETPCCGGKEE